MEWEVRWPDGRVEQVAPGSEESWDWKQLAPGVFDVRMGNRNVRIERMDGPDEKGNVTIRVNGVVQALQVLGPQQLLLESMGMSENVETQEKHVESPMPGKILQVMVATGTEVDEGDPLLVLEAMKMENVIRAPRSGVIAVVQAQVGEAVEKAAILVTYEMNE
ncbi:acetyl-CoA carboxylase biotin carboxyl carrier protein subunit [Flavobacteriales bacterium]|jgi:acetyl/propionyl-CoA carboxylase alpha subunit|nr:acetyl-CoA carboxylase biotin carboxyl carrier protein subunit [Flavobacteriales bacterium]